MAATIAPEKFSPCKRAAAPLASEAVVAIAELEVLASSGSISLAVEPVVTELLAVVASPLVPVVVDVKLAGVEVLLDNPSGALT